MAAYPQSTAYTRSFNAYLASDHVTAATGLTIVVTLSKAGGAYAAAGGTVTEISNGLYKIALTTTDTNTVGDLAIRGAVATMDDVKFVDQVTDPIRGLGAPTALPGVAAGAANGLLINGANSSVNFSLNTVTLGTMTTTIVGNITGNLSGSVGSVTGAVGSVTGAVGSVTATVSADIKKVNGVTVNGDGSATKWGP